jgi:hypothetical protein
MPSEEDFARMTEACRALPEPTGDYAIDDYLTNLMATVVDFQTQTPAVEKALNHFSTKVRRSLRDLGDLVELMGRWPADKEGNTALALHLWGYKMWTRAQMLRDLVAYFSGVGVTDQPSLQAWAASATFERDFKGRVRGLGPAVFQWLVMRLGVDTVKPDVHVHRFAAETLGRPLSDAEVVEVVVTAARRLGRPAHRLDWAIWEAGRAGAPTGPTAPSHREDAVALGAVVPESAAAFAAPLASFIDDDAGYLSWIGRHPDGYVLNCGRVPSQRYIVVHKASCHTVAPRRADDRRSWTISYRKVCSTAASALVGWAKSQTGRRPTTCGICQPRG